MSECCSIFSLLGDLPPLLVPSLAAYEDLRLSMVVDDGGVLRLYERRPCDNEALTSLPGPISMVDVLGVGFSREDTPGMLGPGDAGGIGGGAMFCEGSRVDDEEACRGRNGEGGTEFRSGAIYEVASIVARQQITTS